MDILYSKFHFDRPFILPVLPHNAAGNYRLFGSALLFSHRHFTAEHPTGTQARHKIIQDGTICAGNYGISKQL